jgi:hypothetical protein
MRFRGYFRTSQNTAVSGAIPVTVFAVVVVLMLLVGMCR